MDSPAELLRAARARAHLSASALAARSGVSPSAVLRIEAGEMDPTVGMLARLLEAAGERLRISSDTTETPVELARLVDAWKEGGGRIEPDWTRLRATLDALQGRPQAVATAIARPPARSGSPVVDVLLAGIADKLADDHQLPRPAWTSRRTLKIPWAPAATPRQHAYQQKHTPRQLAQRNIVVDAGTLWRDGPARV
ncbi:MAG TPA: helix-turn-helix transcriptional regulator [Mycobacteriales bacterium]|nr:helix-turn-helix transcriptional regulator [Mycobacteriales bacterium]